MSYMQLACSYSYTSPNCSLSSPKLFVQCASVGLNPSATTTLAPSLSSSSSSSSSSSCIGASESVIISDSAGLPSSCSTASVANMYSSTAAAAAGLLAYPRVAAFPATDYTSYGQPYVPFDSSAFYTPLGTDSTANDTWRSLSQTTTGWPYDHAMAAYPYGPSYGGLDVRRKNATRESTSTLKAWLYEHIKNPYPTKGEKIMLAIITKMTLTQVSTWFANARRRLKKENKMQWSPRNRTDNDDDDKSTSDDDADAGNGNGKNDDVTAGNGTETRMTIGAKDSDDDVVVDNVGCDEPRLRGAECGLTVDGRQLSSCRQDSISSSIPVAPELPSDPRLVARPSALRQPTDITHHGSLLPSAAYGSTGSFYYAGGPLVDLSGSCQRLSTFCRGAGLASGSEEDDDDGHVASSEEEESKPRIWSLADVATSCRGTIRAGTGSTSSCMTGTGGHPPNGGSFLPWSNSGYYAPAAGSSGIYPSYYQTAAAAAAVAQQKTTSFRPSEMIADSAVRHHPHQLLPQGQNYLRQPHQQHRSIALPRNSSFSPGSCSQQQPASSASQFNDVIGFCAAGAMDVRRVVTSEPSHMTSGPTSAELHPVYPSPHAANPSAAAVGIPVSEPQTAFRPVAKRL